MNFDLSFLQNTLKSPAYWLGAAMLVVFSSVYNLLVDHLDTTDNSALVVGGVMVVLFTAALTVSFGGSVLVFILFAAAGVPMIIGEYRRRARASRKDETEVLRVGYTSNQIIDGAVMHITGILRELLPVVDRKVVDHKYTISDTELCQRVAVSIDQAHKAIGDLKALPRARRGQQQ